MMLVFVSVVETKNGRVCQVIGLHGVVCAETIERRSVNRSRGPPYILLAVDEVVSEIVAEAELLAELDVQIEIRHASEVVGLVVLRIALENHMRVACAATP